MVRDKEGGRRRRPDLADTNHFSNGVGQSPTQQTKFSSARRLPSHPMLPLKAYILCEAARLIYRRWSPSLNWAKSCRCSWEKSRYPLMHLAGSQHLSRGICRRSNRLAVCKRPRCSSFLFPDYTAGRRSTSKDEGDNEQNQKDDKQHVGDPRRFTGHTA